MHVARAQTHGGNRASTGRLGEAQNEPKWEDGRALAAAATNGTINLNPRPTGRTADSKAYGGTAGPPHFPKIGFWADKSGRHASALHFHSPTLLKLLRGCGWGV